MEVPYWFTHAAIANQPYLAPSQAPAKKATDYTQQWSDDIHQDVLNCADIVRKVGLEMLVINQTRPDIGLPRRGKGERVRGKGKELKTFPHRYKAPLFKDGEQKRRFLRHVVR